MPLSTLIIPLPASVVGLGEYQLSQSCAEDFCRTRFRAGKFRQNRKADLFKVFKFTTNAKFTTETIKLVLRRFSVGLNGNDEFVVTRGVQSGKHTDLINFEVLLDPLFDRPNGDLFPLDIEDISDPAEDTNSPVRGSHRPVARIEKSIAEYLCCCFVVVEIAMPIKLGRADAQIAFVTRRTFLAALVNDLDRAIRRGRQPHRIIQTLKPRAQRRFGQFGRRIIIVNADSMAKSRDGLAGEISPHD